MRQEQLHGRGIASRGGHMHRVAALPRHASAERQQQRQAPLLDRALHHEPVHRLDRAEARQRPEARVRHVPKQGRLQRHAQVHVSKVRRTHRRLLHLEAHQPAVVHIALQHARARLLLAHEQRSTAAAVARHEALDRAAFRRR
jgi:hypothetical protein